MNNLPPRRKLLLGFAACAALAWLTDTWVLKPAPRTAAASTAPAPDAPDAAPGPSPVTTTDLTELVTALHQRDPGQAELDLTRLPRDPFVLTPTIVAALEVAPPPSAVAVEPPPEPDEQQAFVQQHQLTGILAGPNPLALVDGVLMSPGDELDGYRLRVIQHDCATFWSDSDEVTLCLPNADAP